MLRLLERIQDISSCRDRDLLAFTIVAALHDLFHPSTLHFYQCVRQEQEYFLQIIAEHDGEKAIRYEDSLNLPEIPLASEPLALESWNKNKVITRTDASGSTAVYPLTVGNATTPYGFFILHFANTPDHESHEAVLRLLAFYSNYIALLDYSELDSLTGLRNRKTFDEIFYQLLAKLPDQTELDNAEQENRRNTEADPSTWLAIIDLDHFKRINDNFGHLFGDEVLLRLGNLMRANFRKCDYLFRFGGEEFIVVIRPNSQATAIHTLERFRMAVESHEFPQVGKVTCSIGFTRVDSSQAPVEIIGHADQALYYAKDNGRNCVHCYETLIEQGVIAAPQTEAKNSNTDDDFDMDALFD